ncbi:Rid family hydrolase [Ruegeria hyattellae]|uniref:Rid family hydrolase n=1 Tax=Ruegeria hyattellae TaxID=3233337 RepID=UPI00355B4873
MKKILFRKASQLAKQAIIPKNMTSLYQDWKMAPGSEVDGFVFLTGFNGTGLDGVTSSEAATQINTAFDQVFSVLDEGAMDARHVIEVTSYHIGLRAHLETFKTIWTERMCEPYPAWTAIEVAGFASEGVVVELRVVAHR